MSKTMQAPPSHEETVAAYEPTPKQKEYIREVEKAMAEGKAEEATQAVFSIKTGVTVSIRRRT